MKHNKCLLALGVAVVTLLPLTIQAAGQQLPPGPTSAPEAAAAKPSANAEIGPEVAGANVVMCFTCGGSYPYRVATVRLGGYNWVWEAGSRCGGGWTWRWDAIPYVCSSRR
jgi:hypothetical protein